MKNLNVFQMMGRKKMRIASQKGSNVWGEVQGIIPFPLQEACFDSISVGVLRKGSLPSKDLELYPSRG